MEDFNWLFFGPIISLAILASLGVAALYFFLGLRNLIAGKKEKSAVKVNSGYRSMLVSATGGLVMLAGWYYSGGLNYLTWLWK